MIRIGRFTLSILATVVTGIGLPGWANSDRAGTPNTWTTVAPLPNGLLWSGVASAAGKLYVFGGVCRPTGFCRTFEAYDPRTNRWTSMGNMPETLGTILSATTGPDGRIYLYGMSQARRVATILVYDPRANTWSHVSPPPGDGEFPTLVTGSDGRIYAVGGTGGGLPGGALSAYNVHTRKWTTLAPDTTLRGQPAATAGPDGRIYVTGGDATSARVEAYDPRNNTWARVASVPTPRFSLQMVTGPDGRIYALGGQGRCFSAPCDEVEAYDVHARTWTAVAPMPHGRWNFVAALGPDGHIYVLGGYTTVNEVMPGSLPKEVDAYTVIPGDQPLPKPPPEPAIATKKLASMPTGRSFLGAATSGGQIYAIGGQAVVTPGPRAPTILRTVEAYDPTTNTWTKEPPLPAPRVVMGVATGSDGRIYVLGGVATAWDRVDPATGYLNVAGLRTVFIYTPTTGRWSRGTPMPDGRYALAAVTGRDGRIYTIGGATFCHGDDLVAARIMPQARPARRPAQVGGGDCQATTTVRAFNPRTNTWTTLAPLPVGCFLPAAAVAPDGRIDVFGCGDAPRSHTFEVYDPGTNRWTTVKGLLHMRIGYAAATAGDGRIELIGGCLVTAVTQTGFYSYCGDPGRVDAYDPQTNTWTSLGVTLNARQALAATTGPDGHVYAVGGAGYGNGRLLEMIRQG